MKKRFLLCGIVAAALAACVGALVGCSGGGNNSEYVEHVHVFDREIAHDVYFCTEANCTQAATYYYSCECGEHGTETFEYGEPEGHYFATEFTVDKEPSCTEAGLKSRRCLECGELAEEVVLEALGHDFEDKWNYTADEHWHECTRCGEISDNGAHTFSTHNRFQVNSCTSCAYTVASSGWNAEDGLEYALNDDGQSYCVKGIKTETAHVYVPMEYNGLPVTRIANRAFYQNSMLHTVVLQNNITEIGEAAFQSCENLEAIRLPATLQTINMFAFASEKLTDIYITDLASFCGLQKMYFYGGAMRLYINDVEVTDLVIPEGVEEIYYSIFGNFVNFESITIPSTLTKIDDGAFYGLEKLSGITVAANNPVYHSAGNCLIKTNTKTLVLGCSNSVIPDDGSVTVIAGTGYTNGGAFSGNKLIEEIVIPEGITEIGTKAFYGCDNLANIKLPDSLEILGQYAFGEGGATFDGVFFYIGKWIVGHDNAYNNLNVTVPEGTVGIADYALNGFSNLRTIQLPESLKYIGSYAFRNCTSLSQISLPYGIKVINMGAFSFCTSLTSVILPDCVEVVETEAFYGCSGLKSFKFGSGIKSVNGDVFGSIPAIIKTVDGVNYVDNCVMSCDTSVTEVVLADGVRVIVYGAFIDCSQMTSITIGKDVVSIGQYAFVRCTSLAEINYEGTKAEWEAIEKGFDWRPPTFLVIHCSDGDIR